MTDGPSQNSSPVEQSSDGLSAKGTKRGRRQQLTPEEQLQIVARVKGGESQSSIARELGYSRQRISAIMNKHAEKGVEGFAHKKRGPKAGPVSIDEIKNLIKMLRDQSPEDFGFKKSDQWTYEKAEAAGTQVFGRKPPKRYLREAFKQAEVVITYDADPDAEIFTPEFKAYMKSAKAREIREREAAYHKRLEEQGLVNKTRKTGRPTKEEAARRAAQPWNPDAASVTADEKVGQDAEIEDIEVPDWNNLSPEEMKALKAKYNMSSYLPGAGNSQSGTRIGKHRKGRGAAGKKRKKKRK